jgi:acetylornithine deacetylase/succinyl-diaminopimelate desuccinylase-like protein
MRRAAVVLLGGVCLGMAAAGAGLPQSPAPDWAAVNREAIETLAAYIRVDTSNPPGNEARGVAFLRRILDAEGIPYQVDESAPGRASLVARLRGGSEPALVLLNHIDVVPADRRYWSVDPFGGVIRDGYIWGRGALDMKSLGVAELMTVLLLHRLHVPLRRDVIFLATADEEAGGNFGAGWVVRQHPEWITGAGFLLNEGATSRLGPDGRPQYFGLGVIEKTPAWLRLTATGPSGHGSIPLPDSAVNHLIAALERLRNDRPPLELDPAIERVFASLAPYQPEPWRSRLADMRHYLEQPGAREALAAEHPEWLALVTNTLAITRLEGSAKVNVIGPQAVAELDCRLLPGWTLERWVEHVRQVMADDRIRIDVLLHFPPSQSSPQTPLRDALEAAVQRLFPGAGLTLASQTGFTDSHFFRERGLVAYGFEPFAVTADDARRVHGNDERIPVQAFTDGVRLLWEGVYAFVAQH